MIMTEHAPAPPFQRPQAATAGQARGRELGNSLRRMSQYQLPKKGQSLLNLFQGLEDSGGEPIHADIYHSRTRMKGEPESEGDELSREEKRQERERQRKAVLAEIVATEKAYVDNLSILMRHFYRPLTEAASEGAESGKKKKVNEEDIPILKEEELQKLFGNIAALYEKHEAFLAKLEEREKLWYSDEKEDCIGDIFYLGTQFFIMYSPYILNYDKSLEMMAALLNEKRFSSYLQLTCGHPELKGLDLSTYLIMPVQRLPRYILLLTELVKATPETHSDYQNVQRCLANVKAAAEVCNTRKELRQKAHRRRSSSYGVTSSLSDSSPAIGTRVTKNLRENGSLSAETNSTNNHHHHTNNTSPRGIATSAPTKTQPDVPRSPRKGFEKSKSARDLEKERKRQTLRATSTASQLEMGYFLRREKDKQDAADELERGMRVRESHAASSPGQVSAFFVEPSGRPTAKVMGGKLSSYGLKN